MKTCSHFILFLVLLSSLVGCTDKAISKQDKQTSFSVQPKRVSVQDTLIITLPKSRPSKLSIRSPEGTFYIVHSKDDDIALLAYDQLQSVNSIKISVSKVEGLVWIDGKKRREGVFKKQGEYLIYMADDLETEPENTFHFMQSVVFQ